MPLGKHVHTFKDQPRFPNIYQLTCPASPIFCAECEVASQKLHPCFESETLKCHHIEVIWHNFGEPEAPSPRFAGERILH